MAQNLDEVKKQYEYFFKNVKKNGDGLVDAKEAADLFKRSGLQSEALKNVYYTLFIL